MLIDTKNLDENTFQFTQNAHDHKVNPTFIKPNLSKKLISIIASSYAINKHIDFYNWLQTSVAAVLPHNMLLACWGDFEKGAQQPNFNYDLTSNLADISTQRLFDSPEKVDHFMLHLYQAWVANDRRWLTINHLNELDRNDEFQSKLPSVLSSAKSLLIYGLSDLRVNNNCLYVFFSTDETFKVQDSLMGILMPHIDSILRRIQHIAPNNVADSSKKSTDELYKLSMRELEIIDWVKQGKTDSEIAMILYISQNTVKSHLKHVFEKLNVTRRAQAVAKLSYS